MHIIFQKYMSVNLIVVITFSYFLFSRLSAVDYLNNFVEVLCPHYDDCGDSL